MLRCRFAPISCCSCITNPATRRRDGFDLSGAQDFGVPGDDGRASEPALASAEPVSYTHLDVYKRQTPGGVGGGFAQQLRDYQAKIKKLGGFFEDARHYQKAKEALAGKPGFKPDLKFEAMLPVLDGREPLAITAAHERFILDAIKFADEQKVKLVILHPRELGKAAAELKAKNIPVIFGRVLELPDKEDEPYDQAFTLPLEAYKAGIK